MIPQEPWLFKGTVKSNIDPFEKFEEEKIITLLDKLRLKTLLEKKLENSESSILNIMVSENGTNLSQGEKQLLCFARALIRSPRILLLDEATSGLDEATDTFLQEFIKKEYPESTILMIAHREHSLYLCDRIIRIIPPTDQ